MAFSSCIREQIDRTPFVDTHEHLLEESTRLKSTGHGEEGASCLRDFSVLFSQYANSDLASAGMGASEKSILFNPDVEPKEKWKELEPYYRRTRHTGYIRNVRESLRLLTGDDDLRAENVDRISQAIADRIKPGFYRETLVDLAGIEHCQVNSKEATIFLETEQPELLAQDLSFVALSSRLQVDDLARESGIAVRNLADWHQVIQWAFATYGPRAIAVKNQAAYTRRLNYTDVSEAVVAPLFDRYLSTGGAMSGTELKAIQDHCFHVCLREAVQYKLPIKLHTGYYAGYGRMPLKRVSRNLKDLCPVLMAHPDAEFVIMHIAYPYQDEAIALAKHYRNVTIDLCWAWIINPRASVRFVKEFLMAAPSSKLLTFGGDYVPVEMVPGHAAMARQGLTQALSELVDEGWIDSAEIGDLIESLMRGNANRIFPYEETLRHWSSP
jgi:predicted TIM-barrel fold metal-dependent hydrolase